MGKILSKSDILRRKTDVIKFEVPVFAGYLLLRPLTDYENSILSEMSMAGLKIDFDERVSPGKRWEDAIQEKVMSSMDKDTLLNLVRANKQASYKICSWCILDEQGNPVFTEEDIQEFPVGLPEQIAEKVREISGLKVSEGEMNSFRG
ncbi:MAG TPA: hypothetical protein PLI71_09355 [Clostridia bacterium]|nr:hypothetical protein [Clostridia bacterium]